MEFYIDVSSFLVHKLRLAIARKQSQILAIRFFFTKELGPNGTANGFRCPIARGMGLESVESLRHPPYSPDLFSCDYHLFTALKELLRGQRFEPNDVHEVVSAQLKTMLGKRLGK